MRKIHQLKPNAVADRPLPKKIIRPCDYGLISVVLDLETQVGSVEAYNKLCDAAEKLKRKIDSGKAQPQNSMFATDPKFIYPIGRAPKL